jgi:6,7-dimethyl-8-ribityllumazine synthase
VTVLKGRMDGSGLRIAVVVSRFNEIVTSQLLAGCRDELTRHGLADDDVVVVEVPGARELPVACRALARSGRFQAVVALGCVVRGQTPHFEYVAGEASRGCAGVSDETGLPVIFGVLTCDTMEQAVDRAGGKMGNKGRDAAAAAIEMAGLLERLGKSEPA